MSDLQTLQRLKDLHSQRMEILFEEAQASLLALVEERTKTTDHA